MKILFLGTHGQYNIGDELLLETFLTQLGQEHIYAVNSYDPNFTQNSMRPHFRIESFHTTRELPRFIKHVVTSDSIFFGGGSIIKELYDSIGRNRYSTLRMILAIVTFSKLLARKSVIMSNIGVGPLQTPHGEWLAKQILRQVDLVSVRDEGSLRTCQRLEVNPDKLRRVPDAVFVNSPEALLSHTPTPSTSDKLRVALNLNYDIENRAAWEGFLASLAGGLQIWNQQQPLEIHTLPMQSRFKAHHDLDVLKAFQGQIPELAMVMHEPQTAQDAAQILADCDLVLAERLHTLVMAAILGKPFFGLVYDVKVQELIAYLGMTDYALDINRPFSADMLLTGIMTLMAHKTDVEVQLKQRSASLRAELEEYFADLRQLLIQLDRQGRN